MLPTPSSEHQQNPNSVDFGLHEVLKLYNVDGPYELKYLQKMAPKEPSEKPSVKENLIHMEQKDMADYFEK